MLAHPNPHRFFEKLGAYGSLGRTLVALSDLEFSHDAFVVKIHEKRQDLALNLSKAFPRQFEQKTDFLVFSIAASEDLRSIPIAANGFLNLQWLHLQLDELYGFRTWLAHGSVINKKNSRSGYVLTCRKLSKKDKGIWFQDEIRISSTGLANVCYTATMLKIYIRNLVDYLDGTFSWEKEYQRDKNIREARFQFSIVAKKIGNNEAESLLRLFPPQEPNS